LSHCWLKLKDFPKWKDNFNLSYKEGKWTTEDNEDEDVQGEATLLAEESKIMMADLSALDPTRRAWFENKQVMIRARDA
jgi:hypothetical protein